MKKSIITLILAAASVALAQKSNPAADLPLGQISVRVTAEDGKPMKDISVALGSEIDWQPSESFGKDIMGKKDGLTDENGNVVLELKSRTGRFGYLANAPAGFYKDRGDSLTCTRIQDGQWLPWNQTVEVVLKRIVNPIPMFAKRLNLGVPALGRPVAFDLEVGDWVAPLGAGKSSDMIFTVELDQRSELDFDYKLTVTFPNSLDGIQTFKTEAPLHGCELRSPRVAPENGYAPQWTQTRTRRPAEAEKSNRNLDGAYFFRVRTVLDAKGKIISANYGKIYGDFMNFTYYLNPTVNDRNVEFDPKRNLFMGLRGNEQVTAP